MDKKEEKIIQQLNDLADLRKKVTILLIEIERMNKEFLEAYEALQQANRDGRIDEETLSKIKKTMVRK